MSNFERDRSTKIFDKDGKECLVLDFGAGAHINQSAREAIEFSREKDWPVAFKFNGIEIVVTKDNDPDQIHQFYLDETQARHDAYKASPEGIEAAREQEERRAQAAEKVESIAGKIIELEVKPENEVVLARLLSAYALPADHIGSGAKNFSDAIVAKIEAFGFVQGDCVGDVDTVAKKKRWIMGQVIDTMKIMTGVPHPALMRFLNEIYAEPLLEESK